MERIVELQVMRYYLEKGKGFMVMSNHQDETSRNEESACARKSA